MQQVAGENQPTSKFLTLRSGSAGKPDLALLPVHILSTPKGQFAWEQAPALLHTQSAPLKLLSSFLDEN